MIDDTIKDNNVTIYIKGWQLNYLFHNDKFKGTLTITPYHFEETNNATFDFFGDILVPSNGMQYSILMRYSSALNKYTNGALYYNDDYEGFMFCDNMYYYISYNINQDEINKKFDLFKSFMNH